MDTSSGPILCIQFLTQIQIPHSLRHHTNYCGSDRHLVCIVVKQLHTKYDIDETCTNSGCLSNSEAYQISKNVCVFVCLCERERDKHKQIPVKDFYVNNFTQLQND